MNSSGFGLGVALVAKEKTLNGFCTNNHDTWVPGPFFP